MSDMVRVTVAPGCIVTISHPSGLRDLPRIDLHGGQVHVVTCNRADALYKNGLILHPVTGQLRPTEVKAPTRPTISYQGPSERELAAQHQNSTPPGDDWWKRNSEFTVRPNNVSGLGSLDPFNQV